ncbi:protein-tyrosine kinase 6 [Notechis scutatus]|uniref:Tyrosine-protein kinase n=1 Tax=Notechis scutatus TaxID=8663 RepID=A0A6J1VM87_9SAUR|nr:protein-tyrosine kinase 6 [Notechis scutatus]
MACKTDPVPGANCSLYTSLWDFQARTKTELTFQAGDLFEVIQKTGEWCWAKQVDAQGGRSEEGYVPYSYLAKKETVETEPWFFGQISRSEAVLRLMSEKNKSGAFLVRISEKIGADFVLSVRDGNLTRHYKILRDGEGRFYMNGTRTFPDLLTLVTCYKEKVLTHGLKLLAPCYKEDIYLSYTQSFPYKWTAPEALSCGCYSIKSDVWSFGILLYEIMTRGQNPYPGMSNLEVSTKVQNGFQMHCPPRCPPVMYSLMCQCWNLDPNQRPDFQNIRELLQKFTSYENFEAFS